MKIREITYIALFASIMGALGFIPPIFLSFTPVPITIQNIGVLLSGGILGARLGAWSQIVFMLLVAAGLPLLSGGRGGIGVFAGPSAGYLIGYIIISFCIGYILSHLGNLNFVKILLTNIIIGVFLLYGFGVPVQAFVMDIPIIQTIKLSLVYIPGDILKAVIASFLVYKLRKSSVLRIPSLNAKETQ